MIKKEIEITYAKYKITIFLSFCLETNGPKVQGLETPAKKFSLNLKSPKLAQKKIGSLTIDYCALRTWRFFNGLIKIFLNAYASDANLHTFNKIDKTCIILY